MSDTRRPHGGPHDERELTEPVALCLPDGRLNPDAVGWSRTPLHDCRLPGRWGRRKRWDFWGVTGPGCALNIVCADVDYLGIADVWFHDFDTGASMARSVPVPLARGVALPDVVGGAPIRFAARGLELSMVEVDDGTRLRVAVDGPEPFEADVLVRRRGHESLGVVIPGRRRYQYTNRTSPARPRASSPGATAATSWPPTGARGGASTSAAAAGPTAPAGTGAPAPASSRARTGRSPSACRSAASGPTAPA